MIQSIGISIGVAAIAALYASVGHGGASGYLAVMAILSFPPEVMKPGALLLNLLVAGIGAIQYVRAGHFRFSLLWPFVLSSIPMSYAGARLHVSPKFYGIVLAVTLLWASVRLSMQANKSDDSFTRRPLPSLPVTLTIGAVIGWISGMVGVGGGIFLSPLFILMNWASPKETSAVSAIFIWVNSLSGIAGYLHSGIAWPPRLWMWVAAAGIGGSIGSYFGAKKWSSLTLRRLLSVVLLVAAVKSAMIVLK